MAPQLDAARHILIKTLLKEEFETKLIASKASCSVRAVQKIRLVTGRRCYSQARATVYYKENTLVWWQHKLLLQMKSGDSNVQSSQN
jgi:hypothetical protein